MFSALARAVADAVHPALRRISMICLAIAAAVFAVLWAAFGVFVSHVGVFGSRILDWGVDLLGAVAVLALTWLLFPAVSTLVFGFFLDRIASQVEALHYPDLPPSRPVPFGVAIVATTRLMSLTIVLNLLALPVYLLLPVANVLVFLALNGYLLGREYFEAVAYRRLDPILVKASRRRLAGRVFFCGVVVAGIFAVPFVNLIAPVIATALMVHEFERSRRSGLPLLT